MTSPDPEKTQNFNAAALEAIKKEQEDAAKMFAEQRKKDEAEASRVARNRTDSAGGKIK